MECLNKCPCRIDSFVFRFKRKKVPKFFFTHLPKTFDFMDADNDGRVCAMDLSITMGIPLDKGQDIISRIDDTNDGIFAYNEFLDSLKEIKDMLLDIGQSNEEPDSPRQAMANAFRLFDREQRGLINPCHLRTMLMNFGDVLSEEECEDFISHATKSREGYICYHKLLDFLVPCKDTHDDASTPSPKDKEKTKDNIKNGLKGQKGGIEGKGKQNKERENKNQEDLKMPKSRPLIQREKEEPGKRFGRMMQDRLEDFEENPDVPLAEGAPRRLWRSED